VYEIGAWDGDNVFYVLLRPNLDVCMDCMYNKYGGNLCCGVPYRPLTICLMGYVSKFDRRVVTADTAK